MKRVLHFVEAEAEAGGDVFARHALDQAGKNFDLGLIKRVDQTHGLGAKFRTIVQSLPPSLSRTEQPAPAKPLSPMKTHQDGPRLKSDSGGK